MTCQRIWLTTCLRRWLWSIPEPVRPKRGRPKKFIQVEDPVQEEGTFGRKVQRKKVVSPALKSGVRKAKPTRSKKTSSPSSKRKRVSAPPSANTSPVLKPPRKSNRRNLGLVEQLIVEIVVMDIGYLLLLDNIYDEIDCSRLFQDR